jgi:O-antigen/teichoic acid export membrane protein
MIGNVIDKSSVGHYAVAGKFVEICIFIPTIMCQTITPILVKIYQTSQKDYLEKLQLFMNITIWGTTLMCLIISIIATPLIHYTFGIQFASASSLLQIMIFKVIGYAHAQVTGTMIIIEKKQKLVVLRNLIGCVVVIGLNLILIPKYGTVGAAISSVVTAFCTGVFSHIIIPPYRTIFPMQIRCLIIGWKDILKIKSVFRY